MAWYTFFDARHVDFSGMIVFPFFVIFVAICLAFISVNRAFFCRQGMDPKTSPALYLIRGLVCFYVLFLLILVPILAVQNHRAKMLLDSGAYDITEGTVSRSSVDYKNGKIHSENFFVGGVHFTVPDGCSTTFYSLCSQYYRGPIRDGLEVRLSHVGNVILKLEIARD